MKKRIISSIMCLAMLLSLIPVTAFAADETGPFATMEAAVTAQAVTKSEDGKTYTLSKDVTLTAAWAITDGEYTLDLAGHKLTRDSTAAAQGTAPNGIGCTTYTINVGSSETTKTPTLTIKDSTGNGSINNGHGTASTISVSDNGKVILDGEKNFTIDNGEKTTTMNSTIKIDPKGTLVMKTGTVDGTQRAEGARSMQNFGTVTISGGTVNYPVQVWSDGDQSPASPGKLTVSGGTLKGGAVVRGGASGFPITGTITITGGTVEGTVGYSFQTGSENATTSGAKIEISGGTFSVASGAHAYLKAGSYITKDGSGYTVINNANTVTADKDITLDVLRIVQNKDDYETLPTYVKDANPWHDDSTPAALPWLVVCGVRNAAPITYDIQKDGKSITTETTGSGDPNTVGNDVTSPSTINDKAYMIWNLKYLAGDGSMDGKYKVLAKMGDKVVATSPEATFKSSTPELKVGVVPEQVLSGGDMTDNTVLGKNVSDIQTGITVTQSGNTFKVSGMSKNVGTAWTDFDGSNNTGNFVALTLDAGLATGEYSNVSIEVERSSGTKVTIDSDHILVWKISDDTTANKNGRSIPVTVNWKVGDKAEKATYTIDLSDVQTVPADVTIDSADPVVTVATTVPSDDVNTVKAVANTIVADPDTLVAANSSVLTAAATEVAKADVKSVEVEVFLDVKATGIKKNGNGAVTSMTFDITPMYRLVTTDNSNVTTSGTAQKLPSTNVKTEVTVNLSGLATATTDKIYAKHSSTWYHVSLTTGENSAIMGTFKTDGFSPFEFVKDNREVNVTWSAGTESGVVLPSGVTKLTPENIGTGKLPGASKVGYTFDGWTWNGQTFKDLSDTLLDALNTEASKNGSVTLVAKFTKNGSSTPDGGTSGTGGGGSSASVSVPSATGGKVTVSNSNAKKGDTVTVTVTPNTGYAVDTVTVTDSKGNAVEVSKTDDTHYTFVMPDGRVTVKATFKQTEVTPPPATGEFTDVDKSAYYYDAVKWAVENGITNGLTATTFGPNNSCTRGQMVTFLWRAAGSPAATGTNSFSDVASGEYYYNVVLWAVEKGITNGTSATTFSPNATVNRAQTVTFLYRYAESPAATGDTNFTDVASNAYYADAVKWAVAEEITNGTSATTFAPASNCTRGQIVTFLYRQIAE